MTRSTGAVSTVAAFVVGTIAAGAMVAAAEGVPFRELWGAISQLQQSTDDLGATQILGFYQVDDSFSGNGGLLSLTPTCDPGDVVVGGGASNSAGNGSVQVSVPRQDQSGWLAAWRASDPNVFYNSRAVCADYDPPHES